MQEESIDTELVDSEDDFIRVFNMDKTKYVNSK